MADPANANAAATRRRRKRVLPSQPRAGAKRLRTQEGNSHTRKSSKTKTTFAKSKQSEKASQNTPKPNDQEFAAPSTSKGKNKKVEPSTSRSLRSDSKILDLELPESKHKRNTRNSLTSKASTSKSTSSHKLEKLPNRQSMDERDEERSKMNMEGESVNQDHGKQKTDDAQIVSDDDSAAGSEEDLNSSDVADLGTEEFRVVKTKLTFVDKSEHIKSFFACSSGVQTTAPRRSGKSTFMNMLHIFLNVIVDEDAKPISNPESSDDYKMFMNLKIGQKHSEFVKEHCGRYPVIFMTLKGVNGKTETAVLDSLKEAICKAFRQHLYLLETAPDGSKSFKNKEMESDIGRFLKYCYRLEELSESNVISALEFLSEILCTHFNKEVVILIDEADAPIMKAITDNMPDETIEYISRLLREMLSAALKDNEFLERSLVSSCVRLSGVFSWEINNQFKALFLDDEDFSETYGFTKEEVEILLANAAFKEVKDFAGVTEWYNGYQILSKDKATIYNGWSVLHYLRNSTKKQKKMFDNYWAKSIWVNILGKLCVNDEILKVIDKLVEDKNNTITIVVADPTIDNILELKRTISNPQNNLDKSQVDFFLQLLWDDGLLSAVKRIDDGVDLRIPNFENKKAIQRTCYTQSLFEVKYKLKSKNIERYIQALKELLQITSNGEENDKENDNKDNDEKENDKEENDEIESDEKENDEDQNKIKEYEEETTKKFEEAMYNFVNAVSLLFSDDPEIPHNESELHHILFYLAYNNRFFTTKSHRPVMKASEELRDIAKPNELPRKAKVSYQSKTKEKRGRKNECDMCVCLEEVAVIFEFKFLKNEKVENSKAALQQIIENHYFTLFDQKEYEHIKTKIYVGLCVRKKLNVANVTAHYLVNGTNLNNAKNVPALVNT